MPTGFLTRRQPSRGARGRGRRWSWAPPVTPKAVPLVGSSRVLTTVPGGFGRGFAKGFAFSKLLNSVWVGGGASLSPKIQLITPAKMAIRRKFKEACGGNNVWLQSGFYSEAMKVSAFQKRWNTVNHCKSGLNVPWRCRLSACPSCHQGVAVAGG